VLPLVGLVALLVWLNLPPPASPVIHPPPPPTPTPTSTPEPAPTATPAPIVGEIVFPTETPIPLYYAPQPVRFVVPRLHIDAPITEGGLDERGYMQDPSGPEEVVWYSFTPTPGSNGNALISGHRDYLQLGRGARAAVFWKIPELAPGDEIFVRTAAEEDLRFVVEDSVSYETDKVPLDEVQAQTLDQVITVITCEGFFNAETRDYDRRRIVRARLAM
jgi:LPXTG-site transpeptidase (sortase) family protein